MNTAAECFRLAWQKHKCLDVRIILIGWPRELAVIAAAFSAKIASLTMSSRHSRENRLPSACARIACEAGTLIGLIA